MNIVLAHGIVGFEKILHISYFNGIKEHLEKKFQAKVITPAVHPIKGIKNRGKELKEKILQALGKTNTSPTLNPNEKIHIIAHSLGGLDSRWLLSPNNPDNIAEHVISLTTIGTPHTGSPIADLFYSLIYGKLSNLIIKKLETKTREKFKETELLDSLKDLTTASLETFNKEFIDNPTIKYFCIAGCGRNRSMTGLLRLNFFKTSLFFQPTYQYIKLIKKEENDGLVTLSSAKRQNWKNIDEPWQADHTELIGHNLDFPVIGKPKNFDYLRKYEEIVEHLRSI
jgi:triacylglycerol lipase